MSAVQPDAAHRAHADGPIQLHQFLRFIAGRAGVARDRPHDTNDDLINNLRRMGVLSSCVAVFLCFPMTPPIQQALRRVRCDGRSHRAWNLSLNASTKGGPLTPTDGPHVWPTGASIVSWALIRCSHVHDINGTSSNLSVPSS